MGSGVLLSQRAYAKRIGRSVGWVNKLVKSGVIELTGPKRKIDPAKADAAIESIKDPTRDAQREANEKRRKEKTIFDEDVRPEESLADLSPEERRAYDEEFHRQREELEKIREEIRAAGEDVEELDFATMTLTEVKIRKEHFQGLKAELDYRRLRGELMTMNDAKAASEALLAPLNRFLDDLPSQMKTRFPDIQNEAIVWLGDVINAQKERIRRHKWE